MPWVPALMCVPIFWSAYGSSNCRHCRRCRLLFFSRLYCFWNRVFARFFEEIWLASLIGDIGLLILEPTLVCGFLTAATHSVEYLGAEIRWRVAQALNDFEIFGWPIARGF